MEHSLGSSRSPSRGSGRLPKQAKLPLTNGPLMVINILACHAGAFSNRGNDPWSLLGTGDPA